MTLFEWTKQELHPEVTIWESHAITIAFSTILAVVVSSFIVRRHRQLLLRVHQELEYRIAAEVRVQELNEVLRKGVEDGSRKLEAATASVEILKEQLVHAQKMESLGTLAGGIAHDFNNLLMIFQAQTFVIQRHLDDRDRTQTAIDRMNEAIHRGAGLVRQMLTFARKTKVELREYDVNSALDELSIVLREAFPKNIVISVRKAANLPRIRADATQFHQVLLNLAVNARDAMPGGGRLDIETEALERASVPSTGQVMGAARYVCVRVSDTGTGMDSATMKRIFEPFFTTKESGKGTGLGLAVVYGIVDSHHGFITVDSQPGRGTTFWVYFPAIDQVGTTTLQEGLRSFSADRGHGESILLVEDEEGIRIALTTLLTDMGYKVVAVGDGQAAIDACSARAESFDLLLTDIGLPRVNGIDVAKHVKRHGGRTRIILASGNADPSSGHYDAELVPDAYLQKPFDPAVLFRTIRRVLTS
jgi:signal transduction histidine kinase